ncbi:hypothetical protein PSACC_03277 [Paramicrosporidium saccamoebae]|uniref:Uncharacterized protein n=1 Tax=Paramicrosporidium saccamoebae TaxID=1246581 RepID=A0A2H9TGQ1_9FUNG|nr:hypothetical protein PSACC_03277 [Paramicrosporidium saccamoebae]
MEIYALVISIVLASAAALRSIVLALQDFESTRNPRTLADLVFYIVVAYAGAVVATGGAIWSHAIGGGLAVLVLCVVLPCFYAWKRHREWERGRLIMELCPSSMACRAPFHQFLSAERQSLDQRDPVHTGRRKWAASKYWLQDRERAGTNKLVPIRRSRRVPALWIPIPYDTDPHGNPLPDIAIGLPFAARYANTEH